MTHQAVRISLANVLISIISRATPYTIQIVDEMKIYFNASKDIQIKRFYINRSTRRLINEVEVQSYLISRGYVIVNLEDLTVDDQVHLFMHADEIIGFHGAGLANILFCNTNGHTKIYEIVDKDCVHPSYLDGVVIPGVKATRTYFHMLAHMKKIPYEVIESDDYFLDILNSWSKFPIQV
jgi:capsular polysaccharide biosynthesis protein